MICKSRSLDPEAFSGPGDCRLANLVQAGNDAAPGFSVPWLLWPVNGLPINLDTAVAEGLQRRPSTGILREMEMAADYYSRGKVRLDASDVALIAPLKGGWVVVGFERAVRVDEWAYDTPQGFNQGRFAIIGRPSTEEALPADWGPLVVIPVSDWIRNREGE